MNASSYTRLAAVIFAIIALLQLVRAVGGWPTVVGGTEILVWPSWIAFIVTGTLSCSSALLRRERKALRSCIYRPSGWVISCCTASDCSATARASARRWYRASCS